MKPLRFLGHPVHPITVHAPFGLLVGANGLDVATWLGLAPWTGDASWWLLAAGLAGATVAVTAGLIDYVAIPKGHPAGSTANLHLGLIACALSAYGVSLALRGDASSAAAVVGAVGLALLLAGGWAGGEMVYGHGIGVRGKGGDAAP